MAGIEITDEMTSEQLEAMTGGEQLKAEVSTTNKVPFMSPNEIFIARPDALHLKFMSFFTGWLLWPDQEHQKVITAFKGCIA